MCPDCSELGDRWRKVVLVEHVDGLDPEAVVLDDPALLARLVVPFANVPTSRPDRPQSEPWGHLDSRTLAEGVMEADRVLQRRSGGPCTLCGCTLTPLGTNWDDRAVERAARPAHGQDRCAPRLWPLHEVAQRGDPAQ